MAKLGTYSRWASWEQGVLSRVGDPEKCQEVIRQRQHAVDDDASEAELVAAEFREDLQRRGHDADKDCIFISSRAAADILKVATETRRPTNQATKHLKTLGLRELTKSKKDGIVGWCWRGANAPEDAVMTRLGECPKPRHGTPAHQG